jgi:hypothetical protein
LSFNVFSESWPLVSFFVMLITIFWELTMTTRAGEYFKAAANGFGAAVGALVTAVGAYQANFMSSPEEKAGGALVLAFLAASEYKFIRDTVRHVRAGRAIGLERHR